MFYRRRQKCYRIVIEVYEPLSKSEQTELRKTIADALNSWQTSISRWTVNTRLMMSDEVID